MSEHVSSQSVAEPKAQTRRQVHQARARTAARLTFRWTLLLLCALIIIVALLLALARLGLPMLAGYKGDIETYLSQQFGSPVSIDDLSMRWEGSGPRLSAFGVTVEESNGQRISIDEVLINVNLSKTALRGVPSVDELTVIGADIALEATADGKFSLHGVAGSPTSNTENPKSGISALSWMMNTDRVALQDARVTFINQEDKREIELNNLNIVALNSGSLHQLRIDLQLPPSLGDRLEIGLDLTGESDDIANAETDIYLRAVDLNADAWRSLRAGRFRGLQASTTGISRLDAAVQLEMWGHVSKGALQTARGRMQVDDVIDVKSGDTVLDRISTDLVFAHMDAGWQIGTDSVLLESKDGSTIINDVLYRYQPVADTAWTLDATGKELDLDLATRLTLSLFDDDSELPRARWLAEAEPAGTLVNWNASFGLIDGRPDISVDSAFYDVRLDAAGGVPGVENLGGSILMQNNLGTLTMQGSELALDVPSAFSSPVRVELMRAALDLDVTDPLRTSIKGDVEINDKGLLSNTRVEVKLDPDSSTQLYVQSEFSLENLAEADTYFPARLVKADTSEWISTALLEGSAKNGELLMFGDINQFPFRNNEGVFKMQFDIEDATVDYLPGWPQARALKGKFVMNGPAISTTATDGYIDSLRVSQARASIDDVFKPTLELSGTGAAKLSDFVRMANTGPLRATLSPALSDVTGTGRAQMDFKLNLPLSSKPSINTVASAQASLQKKQTTPVSGLKVDGSIFLKNNDISFERSDVNLEQVSGAIGFTEDGFRINNLEAVSLGKPVRIDSVETGQGPNRTTTISVYGPMRAADVLAHYEIPLTQFVAGESHWHVELGIPMAPGAVEKNGVSLSAKSSLVGTELILPQPLDKTASSRGDIILTTNIEEGEESVWQVAYSGFMNARIAIVDTEMESLSVRFGGGRASADMPEGIRVEGRVASLGLDGWVESIAALIDDLEPSDTPTPIFPVSTNLNIDSLVVGTIGIGNATLRSNTDDIYINAAIDNRWLRGNARYPRRDWIDDNPARVRIASVDKTFFDALDTAPDVAPDELTNELDPRELPPVHMHVSRFTWDTLDLRDLTIRTSPTVSGLSIDAFGFANASTQMIGEGYWRLRDPQSVNPTLEGQHVSRLNITIQSDNAGEGLREVGFGGTLAGGEGVVEGSIFWPGPVYKPALETLLGELSIDIKTGRILKVEPGAAKLVGLFALSSIPRRLLLDFNDVVLDGLDFETLSGDVQLANGVAHTPLVQLNGSIGVVDITGESNLVDERYNQTITVLPRVSSALPIIGIITGGASAGIGAIFAGGLLKALGVDFDRLGLRQYSLKGSWDAPEVAPIDVELRPR